MNTMTTLDLRGKTITTFLLYEANRALHDGDVGEEIEIITEAFPAIAPDVAAWCRATGHRLVDVTADGEVYRFVIERRAGRSSGRKLAMVISDDGFFEVLSPLGFALAAALEGDEVAIYFQGPGVRVLASGYKGKMHGLARPFSRFPRAALTKAGHLPPAEKIAQLQNLGAQLFACGPSMAHYKIAPADLASDGVIVAEYFTFMEQVHEADAQLYV